MSAPTFTIVTPSFNQAAYVGATIESVLSQAGDFTIEYIVNDGGSTDQSADVIAGYAGRLQRGDYPIACRGVTMQWKSAKDGGQSDAINQGFRAGRGEIVAWINSDDAYLPGALAAVFKAFTQNPAADFLNGDGEVIDEHGQLQWKWLSRPFNLTLLLGYHVLWNSFTNYIMQQATFWRRTAMDDIGLLDETFHYGMDIEYWIRAGIRGKKWHFLPQKLAAFRMIQGTKSLSSPTIFWQDQLEIVRRYRGADRMSLFFTFYYVTYAGELQFDLPTLRAARDQILHRWTERSEDEQRMIRRQADRGYQHACYLVADALLRQGREKDASDFADEGRSYGIGRALHPFAWPYRARLLVGRHRFARVDKWYDKAVRYYRAFRYDYRYRQA